MAEPVADTVQGSSRSPDENAGRFRTFAGTIVQGMDVISSDGRFLGQVDRVEGDHIILVPASYSETEAYFVPLSLIDGIAQGQVLLAGRGDGTFGLGAQP